MTQESQLPDDLVDAGADVEIAGCLDLCAPRSFFLFAGAGSGKTQSLITALKFIQKQHTRDLALHGRRVGVVTYTNAACDEITRRIAHNPLFDVSTIHAFAWGLLQGHDKDIQAWLKKELQEKIEKATAELQTKRPGTKTVLELERSLKKATERLANLPRVRRFVYSPTGDLRGRDALNHSEVIAMAADFLREKPALKRVLVNRYPILFIDESQDTNKQMMAALLDVEQQFAASWCLGLFGDMMQRIYLDGLPDLSQQVPSRWAIPKKEMNHRSARRVIELINKVRSGVDTLTHRARSDAAVGHVRLFPLHSSVDDKTGAEAKVAHHMADATGDDAWIAAVDAYKGLILEHEMAATRMGFQEFFAPLKKIDSYSTGLLDGTLPPIRLFSDQVLPLVVAHRRQDRFTIKRLLDQHSPLLTPEALYSSSLGSVGHLKHVAEAVSGLVSLWQGDGSPTLMEVLCYVHEHQLFQIPKDLVPFTAQPSDEGVLSSGPLPAEVESPADALRLALARPFREVEGYMRYISERSPFGTHQGVKGLEFDRVMVILDDESAGGKLFNYDRLFGVAPPPKPSGKKGEPAKEAPDARTRRLFYVTCSRAKKSLAVVAYTADPDKLARNVVERGWFARDEIAELP
jgi:DNA helicase-2/ATP-dependent DNA helicase PcrA